MKNRKQEVTSQQSALAPLSQDPLRETDAELNIREDLKVVITKKQERLANILGIDIYELNAWLGHHQHHGQMALLSTLHLAITHELDPLLGEVVIWQDANGQAKPTISIDGWIKLINRQPAFSGIEFEDGFSDQQSGEEKLPQFIQCTIYRSDRQTPVRIKEYLAEVKNDHPLWATMPRRMLRHRALQQCARVAFGISTPEFSTQDNNSKKIETNNTVNGSISLNLNDGGKKATRTELLKHQLEKQVH
jgi:hypothetical protein